MKPLEYLGPYRILGTIGRGGMGRVFRAEHSHTGERVAVKLIADNVADDPRFRRRFADEVETLKRLKHPNIVRLIGYGEESGQLFYSMELVEGESLQDRLKRDKQLDWQTVVDMAIDVCGALKHAHDFGVIHRDLKPANLLLDASGKVMLVDFGIAKLFGNLEQTVAGSLLGTADYMAPEQAGEGPITTRVDLYALGNVLYACFVGHPPFVYRSVTLLIESVRRETPRRVEELNPKVPLAIAELIHDLLAKRPEDRPPTALAVMNRLKAIREGLKRTLADQQAALEPRPTSAPHGDELTLGGFDADDPTRDTPSRDAVAQARAALSDRMTMDITSLAVGAPPGLPADLSPSDRVVTDGTREQSQPSDGSTAKPGGYPAGPGGLPAPPGGAGGVEKSADRGSDPAWNIAAKPTPVAGELPAAHAAAGAGAGAIGAPSRPIGEVPPGGKGVDKEHAEGKTPRSGTSQDTPREDSESEGRTHFQTVHESERARSRFDSLREPVDPHSHLVQLLSVLGMLTVLAIGVSAFVWATREPSSDELYRQMEVALDAEDLPNWQLLADRFQRLYPDDPRQADVAAELEFRGVDRVIRKLRLVATREGGTEKLAPDEIAFLEAVSRREEDPQGTRVRLGHWLALFAPEVDLRSTASSTSRTPANATRRTPAQTPRQTSPRPDAVAGNGATPPDGSATTSIGNADASTSTTPAANGGDVAVAVNASNGGGEASSDAADGVSPRGSAGEDASATVATRTRRGGRVSTSQQELINAARVQWERLAEAPTPTIDPRGEALIQRIRWAEENLEPRERRRLLEGLVTLFADKAWARGAVQEARRQLTQPRG